MQAVPGHREPGNPHVLRLGPCALDQNPVQPVHQEQLEQEPQERREVEVKGGFKAPAQPVVDGEGSGHQRAPTAVLRSNGEGCRVGEEPGDVAEIADVDVVADGVEIVEEEGILEMVGIGESDGGEHRGGDQSKGATTRRLAQRWHCSSPRDHGRAARQRASGSTRARPAVSSSATRRARQTAPNTATPSGIATPSSTRRARRETPSQP